MKLEKSKLIELLSNAKNYKNNNLKANCPWCGQGEFYISLNDNHLFQCWRKKKCGVTGNIFTLLDKLGRFDLYSVKESVTWSKDVQVSLKNELQEEDIDLNLEEVKLPLLFKRIYKDKYLEDRGFKPNDFYKYVIGETNLVSKLLNYVIFVIYQESKPVAYIARYRATKKELDLLEKKTGKKIVRYRNSESDFEKILGGYDELVEGKTKTVILVEGLFDKKHVSDLLSLEKSDEVKCCFTFKCHVSDQQLYKLKEKGIENIILLYDPDVISKIKEQAISLVSYFKVKIGFIEFKNESGELKDPAELSFEELITILNCLYLPLDFYTKKVQILNL